MRKSLISFEIPLDDAGACVVRWMSCLPCIVDKMGHGPALGPGTPHSQLIDSTGLMDVQVSKTLPRHHRSYSDDTKSAVFRAKRGRGHVATGRAAMAGQSWMHHLGLSRRAQLPMPARVSTRRIAAPRRAQLAGLNSLPRSTAHVRGFESDI